VGPQVSLDLATPSFNGMSSLWLLQLNVETKIRHELPERTITTTRKKVKVNLVILMNKPDLIVKVS
jgi:hypothetical protein